MKTLRCSVHGAFLVIVLLLSTHQAASAGQATGRVTSFAFRSAILGEERTFQVFVPPESGPGTRVIFVLDGQAHFTTVVDALTAMGDNRHVVIGIGNIWLRDRDYTPTRVRPSEFVSAAAAAASGGGERFLAHLTDELLPYVESHYAKGTSRLLVGHSLGGLMAVNILLIHPRVFDALVIIDPSMWWDDSRFVAEATSRLRQSFAPTAVFLAIANAKNRDLNDIDAVRSDTTGSAALIRPSVLLLDQFKAHQGNGIDVVWRYYKDHDHMSVVPSAVRDGLASVLR
jgi:predicted alpha/beta superfamily hydrolase